MSTFQPARAITYRVVGERIVNGAWQRWVSDHHVWHQTVSLRDRMARRADYRDLSLVAEIVLHVPSSAQGLPGDVTFRIVDPASTTTTERYEPQVGDRVTLPHWQTTYTVLCVGEQMLFVRSDAGAEASFLRTFEWIKVEP